jgi:hypothetical protein
MWICLNNAFFSIVTPRAQPDAPRLVVRARRKGDIERVFVGHKGVASPGRDYAFRAEIPRAEVGRVIAACVAGIDYSNFKDSVRDAHLHSAYSRVWGVMGGLQVGGPFGSARPSPRQRPLPMGHNYGPAEAAQFVADGDIPARARGAKEL